MRVRLTLLACVTGLAMPTVCAAAATPVLSGHYVFSQTEMCQAQISTTSGNFMTGLTASGGWTSRSAVTGLVPTQPGDIAQSIGIATLTPTTAGASSGKITVVESHNEGSLILLSDGSGTPAGQTMSGPATKTSTGTYVATANSMAVTFAGGTTQTLTAVFGAPLQGIVRTVMLMGNDGSGCTQQITFIHQ